MDGSVLPGLRHPAVTHLAALVAGAQYGIELNFYLVILICRSENNNKKKTNFTVK